MRRQLNNLIEFDQFRLEPARGWLKCGEEVVPLPPKAVLLLRLLLQNAGQVVRKDQILANLWPDTVVEESNLTQYVHLLRKIFKQHGGPENLIETLPRVGYRFNGAVREVAEEPEQMLAQAFPESLTKASAPAESQTELVAPPVSLAESPAPPVSSLSAPSPATVALAKPARAYWRTPAVMVSSLLVLLLLTVVGVLTVRTRNSAPLATSVAVLPFTSLGVEPLDPSLRLGLADALITRLGSLNRLEVRPTAAVRSYTEKEFDPLQAGRDLRVEALVTGNIQRENGRLRVTIQILRIADQKTLWAGQFDESFTQLFALQDRLATQTASALRLTEAEALPARRDQTANLEAYQLYLKGRYFWNRRTPEWIKKGIECFDQAIKLDPNYALAWAGLADSYALTSSGLPGLERMTKSRAAAEQALKLNPALAEAHASLGFIKYKYDWDWAQSERELRRAIELSPNYSTAHHWLAECLDLQGRFDEALAAFRRAEQLEPLSLAIKEDIGLHWCRARQYDRAAQQFLEVRTLDPTYARVRSRLARIYELQGRQEEALTEHLAAPFLTRASEETRLALKDAMRQSGWRGFWQQILAFQQAGKLTEDAQFIATVHIRLGDLPQALTWLEKSFAEHGGAPLEIKTNAIYDPLRAEPRFQELLRRAGHTP